MATLTTVFGSKFSSISVGDEKVVTRMVQVDFTPLAIVKTGKGFFTYAGFEWKVPSHSKPITGLMPASSKSFMSAIHPIVVEFGGWTEMDGVILVVYKKQEGQWATYRIHAPYGPKSYSKDSKGNKTLKKGQKARTETDA